MRKPQGVRRPWTCLPRPQPLQLTGPVGQTRCLPYTRACPGERLATHNLGWSTCPTWSALLDGARPAGDGTWRRGLAARLAVPRIADDYRTLSRSRAPALLAAQFERTAPLPGRATCPATARLTDIPQAMQIALKRRLRLPLPLAPSAQTSHGAGAERRPSPGPRARPRRQRWAQPLTVAALSRDRVVVRPA